MSLLSSTSGALYGMLYEATMHAVLTMVGGLRTGVAGPLNMLSAKLQLFAEGLFVPNCTARTSQGGCFTAVPISYGVKTSTFIRGVEEKLQFDPCTEQEFFEVNCLCHWACWRASIRAMTAVGGAHCWLRAGQLRADS